MQKTLIVFLIFIHTLVFSQEKQILKTYSAEQLHEDFDLMISSLKEAHAGLYWYNSMIQFDSIANVERSKIKDDMNSYDFFRIASKIVTATKEGHCRISSSKDIGLYFNQNALILPLAVKMLNGKIFVLNNIENKKTKGQILVKINNIPIEQIVDTIFTYSPRSADGYIKTGKIRYSIDYFGLAYYYVDLFKNETINKLELLNPKTNKTSTILVNSLSASEFKKFENQIEYPETGESIQLYINKQNSTAQLAIHSFKHSNFDKKGDEKKAFAVFSSKMDSVFSIIQNENIQNLILDIRNNGGGTEGYEDYVFSYLTNKPYSKYKYVEANALTFSFLNQTQYDTAEKRKNFEKDMSDEFYLEKDGRYLRKNGFMQTTEPKQNWFTGNVYVLISGKTYSGGSEFASLLKAKTNAIFIGEETGGGFYGQTSGFGLKLSLPNTQTKIQIPLLKFVTAFESTDIPFGRGVIPDFQVQPTFQEFSNGIDAEMNFALKQIAKKQKN